MLSSVLCCAVLTFVVLFCFTSCHVASCCCVVLCCCAVLFCVAFTCVGLFCVFVLLRCFVWRRIMLRVVLCCVGVVLFCCVMHRVVPCRVVHHFVVSCCAVKWALVLSDLGVVLWCVVVETVIVVCSAILASFVLKHQNHPLVSKVQTGNAAESPLSLSSAYIFT